MEVSSPPVARGESGARECAMKKAMCRQTDAEMSKHIDGSLETIRGDVPNLHEGRLYIAFSFATKI
jgi:hypothetical protein